MFFNCWKISDSRKATLSRLREWNWGRNNWGQSNSWRKANDNVSEWNHAMYIFGAGPSGHLWSNQMSCTSDVETESRTHDTIETCCQVRVRRAENTISVHRARSKRRSLRSARGQRLGWNHSIASKHVWEWSRAEVDICPDTVQQFKTLLDSVVRKASTTHSRREDDQDFFCKACLPTGTWSYNFHFTQTLQARRQLHREEELARTLVTYRRWCCGYKNTQQQNTCELAALRWQQPGGEDAEARQEDLVRYP